jgi:hypothetical protein
MVYKPNLNTRHLTIDVFYQAGDPAFVCAANGPIITDTVQELEDLLANEYQRDLFIHGDGIYTLEAEYESGQYGPEGRCELPPGYGLHVMAYRGITEDDQHQDISCSGCEEIFRMSDEDWNARADEARIRRWRDSCIRGEKFNDLGDEFGVTPETIGRVHRRATWKHI